MIPVAPTVGMGACCSLMMEYLDLATWGSFHCADQLTLVPLKPVHRSAALFCTALHCTALHRTVPHCTAPHRTAQHRTAQYGHMSCSRKQLCDKDAWAPYSYLQIL
jgi:hypothetical protein